MEIKSEVIIEDQELNEIIIKNFNKKINFFEKYLNYKKNNHCIICGNNNLKKVAKQFRHFFFSDIHSSLNSSQKYYNDVKYCLNNENLLFCNTCGLAFSEFTYPYQFYLDYLSSLYDQTDPMTYDENLLKIDEEWGLEKHIARINFLDNFDKILNKNLKFLEISSYRGWGLNNNKSEMDVYGIEAHKQSVDFNKINFPYLADKVDYNLFELSDKFLNKNKNFDVILISQAFRLMRDPFASIELLNEILNDDGYLIISESDFLDTIITEYFEDKKSLNDLNKIFSHAKSFYYSKNHIKFLFESNGFEFIKYERFKSSKIKYIDEDLLLFRKKKSNKKIEFKDYDFDYNFKSFDSVEDVFKEDRYEFKRFFIDC